MDLMLASLYLSVYLVGVVIVDCQICYTGVSDEDIWFLISILSTATNTPRQKPLTVVCLAAFRKR